MKRRATEEALGASPPKRAHIDGMSTIILNNKTPTPYNALILPMLMTMALTLKAWADLDDGDEDYMTDHTPSSDIEAETPITAATTPRTKFPSDYKTLACTWPGCPKTFNRPARLRDHLNSHTNSRPFKCTYDGCDKDYIEDKHLKQHVKAVHTHERNHVCTREGCGKSFVTGTRLKRHQAVHEGADRFRCQDCGQSFRKKETLSRHVRKEHQGLSAYPCSEQGCSEMFDSKAALNRHREKDHGELKYWCVECGPTQRTGFTTSALLLEHMKKEHQLRKCCFCDNYETTSRWEFNTHFEIHHSGKTVEDRQTIPCPHKDCVKKFTKQSNLKVHIRTVHGSFRFICGEEDLTGKDLDDWSNTQGCGDKFSTKARLIDHIRYIHLRHERGKHSQPIDKKPKDPMDLLNDISGVTNEAKQTIACPHCDEHFIRHHDLNIHLSKGHDLIPGVPAATSVALESSSFLCDAEQQQPTFRQDDSATSSAWPDDMPQEEIFAAQMEYSPPHDEWLEDETNIMLLTRDESDMDTNIDPALAGF